MKTEPPDVHMLRVGNPSTLSHFLANCKRNANLPSCCFAGPVPRLSKSHLVPRPLHSRLPRPDPGTPHPTCRPPHLSRTPEPPSSSSAWSPRASRPGGRSLPPPPPALPPAAGFASSGLARRRRSPHARGPWRGPGTTAATASTLGRPDSQHLTSSDRTASAVAVAVAVTRRPQPRSPARAAHHLCATGSGSAASRARAARKARRGPTGGRPRVPLRGRLLEGPSWLWGVLRCEGCSEVTPATCHGFESSGRPPPKASVAWSVVC